MAEGKSLLSSSNNDGSDHGSSWSNESQSFTLQSSGKIELLKTVVRQSIDTIKQSITTTDNNPNLPVPSLSPNNIATHNVLTSLSSTTTNTINPDNHLNLNQHKGNSSETNNLTLKNSKISYCSPENILLWKMLGNGRIQQNL